MPTPTPEREESWEDKFEKGYKKALISNKFSDKEEYDEYEDGHAMKWTKSFISNLITKEREAERGRIIGIAESMKKEEPKEVNYGMTCGCSKHDGGCGCEIGDYNIAITELITRIKG